MIPVAEAAGAILAHSIVVGGTRWAKGRVLTAADTIIAQAGGFEALMAARLDPGDIGEDEAAALLGASLAGGGVALLAAAHGRANLAARAVGVFVADAAMADAVNTVDEALTLATLAPFARVAAGEIVATVKVIRYAVPAAALDAAIARAAPLAVRPFRPLSMALIATRLPGVTAKAMAKTVAVTRARVESIGSRLTVLESCPHDTAVLAARLGAVSADIVLIAGASATVDRADVIPAAIVAAGGEVLRLGMPVDPGNLLVLGALNGRPIIGLPGCARSPKRSGFDWVLERLAAGISVTATDIAAMGAGGLLPEAERPQPRAAAAW